jgi:hypothetical protein
MARTHQTITNEEGLIYQQWCQQRGVNPTASAELVARYFQETWPQDLTEANLELAFPQLKPHLTFYSTSEVEVHRLARENPQAAQKVAEWLDTQTFLIKEGESGFQNFINLFEELRGRDITKDTIAAAMGRIEATTSRFDTRVRRPLHYVQSRRELSPAAQADDPNRKPGEFISTEGLKKLPDGSWGKTPADYQREAIARSAANNPTQTPAETLSKEEQAWKNMVEHLLHYGNHARQAEIKKLYAQCLAQNFSWRRTFDTVNQLVNQFKRAAAGSFRQY